MKSSSRIRSLLRNLLRKQRLERQLEDELQSYVEMLTDEKMAAGFSRSEARRVALKDIGGIEQVKQAVRDRRAGTSLEVSGRTCVMAGANWCATPASRLR